MTNPITRDVLVKERDRILAYYVKNKGITDENKIDELKSRLTTLSGRTSREFSAYILRHSQMEWAPKINAISASNFQKACERYNNNVKEYVIKKLQKEESTIKELRNELNKTKKELLQLQGRFDALYDKKYGMFDEEKFFGNEHRDFREKIDFNDSLRKENLNTLAEQLQILQTELDIKFTEIYKASISQPNPSSPAKFLFDFALNAAVIYVTTRTMYSASATSYAKLQKVALSHKIPNQLTDNIKTIEKISHQVPFVEYIKLKREMKAIKEEIKQEKKYLPRMARNDDDYNKNKILLDDYTRQRKEANISEWDDDDAYKKNIYKSVKEYQKNMNIHVSYEIEKANNWERLKNLGLKPSSSLSRVEQKELKELQIFFQNHNPPREEILIQLKSISQERKIMIAKLDQLEKIQRQIEVEVLRTRTTLKIVLNEQQKLLIRDLILMGTSVGVAFLLAYKPWLNSKSSTYDDVVHRAGDALEKWIKNKNHYLELTDELIELRKTYLKRSDKERAIWTPQ